MNFIHNVPNIVEPWKEGCSVFFFFFSGHLAKVENSLTPKMSDLNSF